MTLGRTLGFVLMLLMVGACGQPAKPPANVAVSADLPTQESWSTRVVFSDSGSARAVLQAKHIAVFDQRRETLMDSGFVVDFYDVQGKHTTRLSGDRGRVDDATRDMEAFGHVVAVSDSGTTVKTEYLKWVHESKKMRSHAFVNVTSPKERLQGYGFEADQSLKNYVIYRVSGEAQVESR